MAETANSRHELAVGVVVAVAGGAVSLAGPDAAAAATALSPLALAGLDRVREALSSRRRERAAETLMDAADAAGAITDEQFMEFVESAVSDERRQELLARVLTIAQDTAMKTKRRALSKALAKAVTDNDFSKDVIDEELLFIRVLNNLNALHIALLQSMASFPVSVPVRDEDGGFLPTLPLSNLPADRLPEDELMPVLEQHHLVASTDKADALGGPVYQLT